MVTPYESNQQVFEIVSKHLFSQGVRSFEVIFGDRPSCLHRGPNGTSCAIGCLIPDSLYEESFNRLSVASLLSGAIGVPKDIKNLFVNNNLEFLQDLQLVHDNKSNWDSSSEMRQTLETVGKNHNLDTEFLDNLSFKDR